MSGVQRTAPLRVNSEGTGEGLVKETNKDKADTSDFRLVVCPFSRPTTGRGRKPKTSNTVGQSFTPHVSPDTSELQNSECEPGSHITSSSWS